MIIFGEFSRTALRTAGFDRPVFWFCMRQLLGAERLHNDQRLCGEGDSAFRMTIAAGKFHALSPPRLLVAAFGREAGSQAYGLRSSPHMPRSPASTTQESQHGKLFSRLASASGLPCSLVTRIALQHHINGSEPAAILAHEGTIAQPQVAPSPSLQPRATSAICSPVTGLTTFLARRRRPNSLSTSASPNPKSRRADFGDAC